MAARRQQQGILLELHSILEGDVGDGGQGQEVLHAVGNTVRSRGHTIWRVETDGGNIGHSSHELGLDVIVSDIQNLGAEDLSLLVILLDDSTVAEREAEWPRRRRPCRWSRVWMISIVLLVILVGI